MNEIVMITNAHRADWHYITLACKVSKSTSCRIIALFVENSLGERLPLDFESKSDYLDYLALDSVFKTSNIINVDQAIKEFEIFCQQEDVSAHTFYQKRNPIEIVIQESRYADLFMFDPEIQFNNRMEQTPSHFTKEVLANIECPVLLAPILNSEIHEIVFCYDVSTSSIFQIKRFTYLFPEFGNKKVTVLEVRDNDDSSTNDDYKRLLNWLKRCFYEVDYQR